MLILLPQRVLTLGPSCFSSLLLKKVELRLEQLLERLPRLLLLWMVECFFSS